MTPVRVLLRIDPQRAAQISERLSAAGIRASAIAPDLVASTVSPSLLPRVVRDEGVLGASIDADVRALAISTTALSSNVLLASQGLGTTSTYTGKGVGVAVVDSGFVPSEDLGNVTASYDFGTGVAVKQGPKDQFGHGTHVSGLIGSLGATSAGDTAASHPACGSSCSRPSTTQDPATRAT